MCGYEYINFFGIRMHILVTGAAGFLGSHLCDALLSQGHSVVGVDNLLTGNYRNIEKIYNHARTINASFRFIKADVCDATIAKQLKDTEKFDQVYFLACPASPIDYVKYPLETLYIGSFGCRNYLELALAHNARFLLTSTSEVYGDPLVHPQPEEYWGNVNPIGPRSVYDESKRYAESLTMAFHKTCGLEIRIARIFNTFGPRMRHDDGRVVPTFIMQALQHQPLSIFGDGSQTRSFCFYSDLIRGLLCLMDSDKTGPYNLGNPHELNMLELAENINDIIGNPAGIIHNPLPKDDPTRRRPDLTNTKRDLGWEPEISFADGLAETVQFFVDAIANKEI